MTTRKSPTRKGSRTTAKHSGSGKKGTVRRPARPQASASRAGARLDERGRRSALASAKVVVAAALAKKAIDPVLIDVCGRASYADFIAVLSGRSDRQVDAIAEGVCAAMAEVGRRPLGREGMRGGRWVLIDFGDVVVHVFHQPLREVFDIESLWIDAPRVKLHVPAENRVGVSPAEERPA